MKQKKNILPEDYSWHSAEDTSQCLYRALNVLFEEIVLSLEICLDT